MYLFLDSSKFIQIGILNNNFKWKELEVVQNKKGAQVIHTVIYDFLSNNGIQLDEINHIFLANGPGSYTGVRVAEGLCQILEIESTPVFTFFHYEAPYFCNVNNYTFYSEAFKDEVFVYDFRDEKIMNKLVPKSSLEESYIATQANYGLTDNIHSYPLQNVYELYKCHPEMIFKKVRERGERQPPFYYRSAENEFSPKK